MNNERRKAIKAIYEDIDAPRQGSIVQDTLAQLADNIQIAIAAFNEKKAEIKSSLEEIRDGEQEYLDNMPENMKSGEKGQVAEDAITALDEAIDMLEDTEDFEGFDKDDLIGKLDEVAGG